MVACICTVLKDFTCIFLISNTSKFVYESRFTTHNTLWISCSPWRGFCGRREIFEDLHYTHWKIGPPILNFFVIQPKNTNGNIETKLLIIIPINIYTPTYKYSWDGGGIHRSFIRSSLRSSLVYLFWISVWCFSVCRGLHDIFTSEFITS